MAKRFYKRVDVKAQDGGFAITLDGRVLKTPGKIPLIINGKYRAELVAGEWRDQKAQIKPETMPCTRLMNVACELTPPRRPELVKEFCAYIETDLLCYRADSPADLMQKQAQNWQPVVDWAVKEHGISLALTTGIKAIKQPQQSLSAAVTYANKRGDAALTLLLHFTASFGSGLLALALMENHLDVKTAYKLSRLDEIYQNERWGEDDDAKTRNEHIFAELQALAKLIGD